MKMKRRSWLLSCYVEVREHPLILAALVVGCTLGLLLRVPLVPWHLDESSATVIGSAIGALMAVSSASWITRVALSREERAAKQILFVVLFDVTRALELLLDRASSVGIATDRAARISAFCGMLRYQEHVHETANRAAKRLEVLVAVKRVDAALAILAADALACIHRYLPETEKLAAEGRTGLLGIPESAFGGHIDYLHDQLDDFAQEMELLLSAVADQRGDSASVGAGHG